MNQQNPLQQTPNQHHLIRHCSDILGLKVDTFSEEEILQEAMSLMQGPLAAQLVTANALLAMDAQKNQEILAMCSSADLVTADSIGLVWAAKRLNANPITHFPGIDLALELCRYAAEKDLGVYLLGASPGVADMAADFLRATYAKLHIAGLQHGFFQDHETPRIIEDIRNSQARFIMVALGSPRQEMWIQKHRSLLPAGLYMGVGGSFDVWSGRLKRAPKFFRSMQLEWFFRLLQEPTRYNRMIQLPLFAWQVEKVRRDN